MAIATQSFAKLMSHPSFWESENVTYYTDGDDPVDMGDDFIGLRETEKALLVGNDSVEFWCPKSAIHDDSEVYAQRGTGRLVLMKWFARKEGLL